MRNRISVVLCFVLALCVLTVFGCAKQAAGPKDEEITKAVQSAVEGGPKGLTLKSPVAILEKGQKLSTGDYPVKVEYTVSDKEGNTKKETMSYKLSSSINDMGVNVWTATETK
ncbi:MAG TPA: hypothetical protein VN328_00445 [Thermodesulfovibrionales bacterium]|nr:hypothetical protein [Thermodesulfovibrionales bacterium]